MLTNFYLAFGPVCFTLLGLWLIVVQTRHAEWRSVAMYRRRAFGVALHFSLPGLMSLLSLIDPDSKALWRVSFAVVAAGGAVVLTLLRGSLAGWGGRAAYLAAVALYGLIAIVATVPSTLVGLGVTVVPARVEAVLLTILVFFGVNVAWLLLFDEAATPDQARASRRPGNAARGSRHAVATRRPGRMLVASPTATGALQRRNGPHAIDALP